MTTRDVQAAATLYTQLPVTVDDEPLYGTAVDEVDAALDPVVVQGSEPGLGRRGRPRSGHASTTIGAEVGDEVDLSLGDGDGPMRITGIVAFPVPEDGGSSSHRRVPEPGEPSTTLDVDGLCGEQRLVHTHHRRRAPRRRRRRRLRGAVPGPRARHPRRAADARRARSTASPPWRTCPRYLAIFLAGLAAAAISFATATTVRQRRRDLAVLRVLGMTGRHVRSVVVVLVLALTAVGALLGGALGLIVGRQVWRAVADSVSLPVRAQPPGARRGPRADRRGAPRAGRRHPPAAAPPGASPPPSC